MSEFSKKENMNQSKSKVEISENSEHTESQKKGDSFVFKGYTGKYLDINLTNREIKVMNLPDDWPKKYIGGIGFGIKTAWDNIPKGVDSLSPENVISFWTGPFAGTLVPVSSKYTAVAKSPLTDSIGFGIASGYFGAELKRAGYDGIVIRGRADKLVYLFIDDDVIQIKDASHLKGKTTWETEDLIKKEQQDESVRVASIGSAGEKLVRYACITNAKNRHVGRNGLGCVMGSKNLKAIALRGTKEVKVADLKILLKEVKQLYKDCRGPKMYYGREGTPIKILVHNKRAVLATKNFRQMTFEGAEKVSGERMMKEKVRKLLACEMCAVACDHVNVIYEGEYKGTVGSVDFESLWALGPLCGVDNLDAITKAVELCDTLGTDTLSTGGVIAWAMECYEKGIFSKQDTDGLDLKFGNHRAMVELVRRIGERDGKFATMLGEGSKRAALQTGKNTIKFAMQIKGLETSAYPFRPMQTGALGHATCITGAFYQRSGSYQYDEKDTFDRFSLDDKRGKPVADGEDDYTLVDSLIICKFSRRIYTDKEKVAELWYWVTGEKLKYADLLERGRRIYTLGKCFNVRHGLTRKDDYLPARAYEEPLNDHINKNAVVKMNEWDIALDSYYKYRGWDMKTSIPTKKTLKELDLNDAADELGV
ncbi:aldehyde ferredoxin oxidoreductase family protein [Candidatus Woesearchaeota archaeon]|nr:aldehyde ferredoxin oxidoreductase family protein [Candidatus Woesearchaeota archaeon]